MKKNGLIVSLVGGVVGAVLSCSAWAQTSSEQLGLMNESEAGIVIVGGNSKSQSYSVKQTSTYGWERDLLRFAASFLKTSSNGVESARTWSLGLRYERALSHRFDIFLGQSLDSNKFAGYRQRYNTDLGGKYHLMKEPDSGVNWIGELGYRFTRQNFVNRTTLESHYLRIYTEAEKHWTPTFLTRVWIEGLPNFSNGDDYLINGEVSLQAMLSQVFSMKTAYLLNFDNQPAPGATEKTDTTFTTALVAKF